MGRKGEKGMSRMGRGRRGGIRTKWWSVRLFRATIGQQHTDKPSTVRSATSRGKIGQGELSRLYFH